MEVLVVKVTVTENAQNAIKNQLKEKKQENSYIRIRVTSFG